MSVVINSRKPNNGTRRPALPSFNEDTPTVSVLSQPKPSDQPWEVVFASETTFAPDSVWAATSLSPTSTPTNSESTESPKGESENVPSSASLLSFLVVDSSPSSTKPTQSASKSESNTSSRTVATQSTPTQPTSKAESTTSSRTVDTQSTPTHAETSALGLDTNAREGPSQKTLVGVAIGGAVALTLCLLVVLIFCFRRSKVNASRPRASSILPPESLEKDEALTFSTVAIEEKKPIPDLSQKKKHITWKEDLVTVNTPPFTQSPTWDVHPAHRPPNPLRATGIRRFSSPTSLGPPPDAPLDILNPPASTWGVYSRCSSNTFPQHNRKSCMPNAGWTLSRYPSFINTNPHLPSDIEDISNIDSPGSSILDYRSGETPRRSRDSHRRVMPPTPHSTTTRWSVISSPDLARTNSMRASMISQAVGIISRQSINNFTDPKLPNTPAGRWSTFSCPLPKVDTPVGTRDTLAVESSAAQNRNSSPMLGGMVRWGSLNSHMSRSMSVTSERSAAPEASECASMHTAEDSRKEDWGRNQSVYSPAMSMFNLYNGRPGQGSNSSGGGNDGESIVVSELSDGVNNDAAEVQREGDEMENGEKEKKEDDYAHVRDVLVKANT